MRPRHRPSVSGPAVRALSLFALVFLLAGCAASRQDMLREADGYTLPGAAAHTPGMATVYVVRPSAVGTLIRFNVFVDDAAADTMEAGYTRGKQYLFFEVPPGEHEIYSVAENTDMLPLDAVADSTYFVRQDAKMGILMARNKLVPVDPVEGKYHLKNTKPGTTKRKSFP